MDSLIDFLSCPTAMQPQRAICQRHASTFQAWVLLAVASAFWAFPLLAMAEDIVGADTIADSLVGERAIRPPEKIKVDPQGLSTPETSNYVSLPTVLFERDKAVLEPQAISQLDQVVAALKSEKVTRAIRPPSHDASPSPAQPAAPAPSVATPQDASSAKLRIEGHTCDLGTPQHNQQLSEARANAVREYLARHGVDAAFLETSGLGVTRPVVPNDSEEHRSRNRRVDFVLRKTPPVNRSLVQSSTSALPLLKAKFEAVSKSEGGKIFTGNEISTLHTGDMIRAEFSVNQGCHVYVLWLESQGSVHWYLPEGGAEKGQYGIWCYFGSEHFFPSPDNTGKKIYYTLDDSIGKEVICIIAAPRPIDRPLELPGIIRQYGESLTAQTLRTAIGMTEAELYLVTFNHVS